MGRGVRFFLLVALLARGLVVAAPAWSKGPDLDEYPNLSKLLDETERSPSKRAIYRIGLKRTRPRPAQKVVGLGEVDERAEKIGKMRNGRLRDYLEDHVARVIVGPGRVPYLINGHHLARAMWDLDYDEILVQVTEDWSDLTEAAFWKRMIASSYVWDEDGDGRKISIPAGLPEGIADLEDDPFRSFAWIIKKKDGFEETRIPFAEFRWAKFFRRYFTRAQVRDPSKKIIADALDLAHSPRAAGLPGYVAAEKCARTLRKRLRSRDFSSN